jgi:hypothetical protein
MKEALINGKRAVMAHHESAEVAGPGDAALEIQPLVAGFEMTCSLSLDPLPVRPTSFGFLRVYCVAL